MASRKPPMKYSVPEGFETLLEGLAKEVLRSQPENIYQFASEYFDSLLSMRESRQSATLETLVSQYNPPQPNQSRDHTVAQSPSSSYQSEVTYHSEHTTDGSSRYSSLHNGTGKPEISHLDHVVIDGENEAASKIQAGFRGFKTRKNVKNRKIRQDKAAQKIQAGYRGHKTRKEIRERRDEEKMAAVKIQSNYRGYRDRKTYGIKSTPKRPKGIRYERYSTDIVSISSEGSLVDYSELEMAELGPRTPLANRQQRQRPKKSRNYQKYSEYSSDSSDTEDQKLEDDRFLGTDSVVTGATDPEGDVILYRQSSDDERHLEEMRMISSSGLSSETVDSESTFTGEEIDYYDAQKAAAKIQAGYRGMLVRRESKMKLEANMKEDTAVNKTQAGHRGYQTREHHALSSESADKSKENTAAAKIQAGYRGMMSRQHLKHQSKAATTIQAGYRGFKTRRTKQDQSEAATRIQASFRGFKIRNQVSKEKEAATKIQSSYRGYSVRKNKPDGTN